jgi:colicin import membrane protein
METINDLLKALDNKVPASIAKRLDGLTKLNDKLVVAREENDADPTEESQEKLSTIVEFIKETQDDLREDLAELVAKKREADAKARQIAKNRADAEARQIAKNRADAEAKKSAEAEARQIAKNRADAEAKKSAEAEALKVKEKEELEQKELLEKEALEATPVTETKKKSGIGWGGLVLGGALLILSAGAINYFGKKR